MTSTAYAYEAIKRQDFVKVLEGLLIRDLHNVPYLVVGSEVVYCIDTGVPHVWIYVYSSFRAGSGLARDVGKDAIRTCLMWTYHKEGVPLGKTIHTKRITTWEKNLKKKVEELREQAASLRTCPDCKRPLVVRENKSTGGKFLGCVGFKAIGCRYTEKIR